MRPIEWDARVPVRVHADRETFDAEAASVTLPLGVLQSGDVAFTPELPASKGDAIRRLGMGDLTKVVLRYKTPFWAPDQYVFGYLCQPVEGNPTMAISLWKTHRLPALVLITGGSLARELERGSDAETAAWGERVVHDLFGSDVPRPTSEVSLSDGWIVATLGAGQVVGEDGRFGPGKRTATVISKGPSRALALDYQRFHRFLLAFPESSLALMRLTVERLIKQRGERRR